MRHFLISLLFILPFPGFTQGYEENITEDFTIYVDHIIAKEFDQAMDYTYDKFFELIPRARMVAMMNATFTNPDLEYELSRAEIEKIGDPARIGNEFFAILTYNSVIRMKFLEDTGGETQEEFEQRMMLTRLSLEELFGPENVFYEAESGFWRLTALKTVCAVSQDGMSDWQFVVMEKEQMTFLANILPAEIMAMVE